MRNLKRVLSLALACVMVIGMMVMTTGAAEIVDYDEITRTEAVDVMNALSIMEGDENGVFNPTGILTREQAAKIICYMLMGKDNAEMLVGTSDFTDVAADRWSAPFISYCASLDIISGYDGKFDPTGELTGVAFAKMLLVALGYDAKVEGYVNNGNWSTNIGSDAIDAGINVKGVNLDAAVTRENAAQMALNTLEADMVYYPGGKGTEIITDGFSVIVGATPAVADPRVMEDALGNEIHYTNGTADNVLQFCEKNFEDLTKNFGEQHGRSGYAWFLTDKPVSISDFVVTDKVLATANGGIDIEDSVDKTNRKFIVELDTDPDDTDEYKVAYYKNGDAVAAESDSGDLTKASFAAPAAFGTSAGNVGVIVEFIDTNRNNKADVINIIEKQVATLTADAATKEVKGLDTQVIVPGVPSMGAFGTTYTVKNVKGYEGLEKGDVVLYYASEGVTYFELAEVVSGKVAGLTNGEPVVNGTAYKDSGLSGASNSWNNDFKNSYDFYLDNAGAIVKAVKTTEETADVYAVPVEISWVTGTGKIDEDNYAEAKLLFTDGTTKIVTVTKVGGLTLEEPSDDSASAGKVRFSNAAKNGSFAITVNNFYTYTIDKDGKYELTTISNQNALDYTAITTGKANFDSDTNNDGTGTNNNIGSTATVFIVKTTAGPKVTYTVYNGINEIPNITATAGTVIYDKSGLASYVYVDASATSGSNADYVVIVPNAAGSFDSTAIPNAQGTGIGHYVVKAIVNGVEQDIKLKTLSIADANEADAEDFTAAVAKDTLYQVAAIDANGVIEKLQAKTTTTGVKVVAGTLATGAASYTTDANTVFYYIDDKGAVSTLDNTSVVADKTDAVYVAKSTNGKAEVVYILQVVSTSATLTKVVYTKDTTGNQEVTSFPANAGSATSAATKAVTIDKVIVADEASYTIDKTAFTAGASTSTETVTITVTAEDGTTTATYTITFTAS